MKTAAIITRAEANPTVNKLLSEKTDLDTARLSDLKRTKRVKTLLDHIDSVSGANSSQK